MNSQPPDPSSEIEVSIIIPALNEAENFPELLRRINAALPNRRIEVLIIDDNSQDNTREVCAGLSQRYPLALHIRPNRHGGLSGAVLHGMALARGAVLVVMDADLQHPPEQIPALIEPLLAASGPGGPEFMVGSRYVPGGSTAEKWGPLRRLNSRLATVFARPFSGQTFDPMSGFFALRRETYLNAQNLTPLGYKIGLELMCKCRVRDVREVPIHFDARSYGESKLTLREQFRYLEHLSRLYDFQYPRSSPVSKFIIATAISWLVAFAVYLALVPLFPAGAGRITAPVLAYPTAILTTAAFHARYVRAQREFIVSPFPWLSFWIISVAEWAVCALSAVWMANRVISATVTEVFLITFGLPTILRYVLRKEFLLDVRGLRRQPRYEDLR